MTYVVLFSSSVALAGFVAAFLVFRYSTLDKYVDNRKNLLIDLLGDDIKKDPTLAQKIFDIGKKAGINIDSFPQCGQFAFKQIILFRKRRKYIAVHGVISIGIWLIIALVSICFVIASDVFYILPFVMIISVAVFVSSLVNSSVYILISLFAHYPE